MRRITAPLLVLALLPGCFGEKLSLPPITVSFPLVSGLRFGPSTGLEPGAALENKRIIDGLTCNLPSDDLILAEVRKQVGGLIAGLIDIGKVNLDSVRVDAAQGSFDSIQSVGLAFITVGTGGIVPLPVGGASSPGGLGAGFTVQPFGEVDLLPILKQPRTTCGAAILTVTGTTPAEDIVFGASLQVTVHLKAGL